MGNAKSGFGSLDPATRRAIASLGGKAAQAKGTAHQWTSAEAKAAGRQGAVTRALAQCNARRVASGLPPLTREQYEAR
jgi:hypothetical protein